MNECPSDNGYVDRLRLTTDEKYAYFKQLDTEEATQPGRSKRRAERIAYTAKDHVLMTVLSPGQKHMMYRILVRNISDHGAAIFHSSFLHQGTPIQLTLFANDGEALSVDGHIQRCGFVSGRVHDIGIQFTTPINAASLMGCDDTHEEDASQASDEPCLRALYVESIPLQQHMVSFLMKKIGVLVNIVSTGHEALSAVTTQPYDLILLDLDLPDLPGHQIITRLRRNGLTVPIIASSTDETVAAKVIEAGGNMLLPKPITQAKLTAMVHQWGPTNSDTLVLLSELWWNLDARPMLCDFLHWLEEQSAQTAELATIKPSELTDRVTLMCQEIQLLSNGMGYPTLSDLAQQLMQQIKTDSRPEAYKAALFAFLEMCDRACSVLPKNTAA